MQSNIIPIEQAAEMLGVTVQTLKLWHKRGHLKYRAISRKYYYLEEDIISALKQEG